jgi:hypothetical protein
MPIFFGGAFFQRGFRPFARAQGSAPLRGTGKRGYEKLKVVELVI